MEKPESEPNIELLEQYACLECCCEFYMRPDIDPSFCPACGCRIGSILDQTDEYDELT